MGFVYLIYDEFNDLYKIGVTRDKSLKRIKTLQTGNACKLSLKHLHESKYPFMLENMLHNLYKNYKIHGEWYEISDVNKYKEMCGVYENCINSLEDNIYLTGKMK